MNITEELESLDTTPDDIMQSTVSDAAKIMQKIETRQPAAVETPSESPETPVPATPATPETPAEGAPEKVPAGAEPLPGAETPGEVAPKKDKPEDFDEELDAVQVNRAWPPQARKAISAQRAISKKYKEEAKQLRDQTEQLKSSAGKIPEALAKEIEDNRRFRAIHTMADDPKFKEKYDGPISEAENLIYDIIKHSNPEEGTIDQLKSAGGIFEARYKDEHKPEGTPLIDSKWWEDMQNKLPNSKKIELQHVLQKAIALKGERTKEIEQMASKRDEYYAEIEEGKKKSYNEDMGYFQSRTDAIQKQYEWAREQAIPADATPEQKKTIEEDNAILNQVKNLFPVLMYPPNREFRFDTAIMAGQSFRLTKIVERRDAEIAGLRQRLSAIQNSSSSAKAAAAAPAIKQSNESPKITNMSLEDAAQAAMERATRRA